MIVVDCIFCRIVVKWCSYYLAPEPAGYITHNVLIAHASYVVLQ